MSGKIDVNILTTGLSSNARKKRAEIASALRKMIESKGKISTISYQKAFNEFKAGSATVQKLSWLWSLMLLVTYFSIWLSRWLPGKCLKMPWKTSRTMVSLSWPVARPSVYATNEVRIAAIPVLSSRLLSTPKGFNNSVLAFRMFSKRLFHLSSPIQFWNVKQLFRLFTHLVLMFLARSASVERRSEKGDASSQK